MMWSITKNSAGLSSWSITLTRFSLYSQQVSHQRWIWGVAHRQESMKRKKSTLALKPRAYVTRSPKQGYQWPQEKDLCPPKIFQKKSEGCQPLRGRQPTIWLIFPKNFAWKWSKFSPGASLPPPHIRQCLTFLRLFFLPLGRRKYFTY